ncbi:hypothetical protein MalM25_23770 [Planctomycetes bacterium MalM25]|nr:hypothetical protein MalM25_23770 [Planctomycetes bacterium MalM25]
MNIYCLRLLSLLLAAIFTHSSDARILEIKPSQPSLGSTPPGYTVNDLLVDFEGRGLGMQMILQLDSGSIFQHELGSQFHYPPSRDLFRVAPTLEADTFLSMGGPDSSSSEVVLVVGASTEFPESGGARQFDESGIDVAWGAILPAWFPDQDDFMVARITLSDDASGRLLFAGGTDLPWSFHNYVVANGRLVPIPEPTTATLLILGVMGGGRRRRG